MTLVNPQTGEVVAAMSPDLAREVTERIKTGVDAIWHLIAQAYEGRAWLALGYTSWDDYCTREFGTSRLRLPREDRQEVVVSLRESGLSIRAIAAATGTARNTVKSDLSQVDQIDPPDDEFPAPVTGTDGKQYQPRQPTKPQRTPLPNVAETAGWQFRKAVERIETIFDDDRFTANRQQVAAHLHGHLSYAIEVCQDLISKLNQDGDYQ